MHLESDYLEQALAAQTPTEYIATLVSYDAGTGVATVRRSAADSGTVQVRVAPLIRAVAPNLLVPGARVAVKIWPGTREIVEHVLDGELAPPTGPVTHPAQGNPFGLGGQQYGVPQSQIVPH